MVIDKELRPLHKRTKLGEQQYHKLLEAKADEILFKHQHPFKWAIEKIKDIFAKG